MKPKHVYIVTVQGMQLGAWTTAAETLERVTGYDSPVVRRRPYCGKPSELVPVALHELNRYAEEERGIS